LIGAVWHTVAGKASAGAAYVFVIVPTVTSFLPAAGPVGTTVAIAGTGFSGATAVTFDGTAATSFTVDSDAQITAVVPAGAGSGLITVTTPGGSGTSLTSFGVIPAPSITLFAPSLGPAGTPVSIAGSGFTGASAVNFDGLAAAGFTVESDALINAIVPGGATTGPISVTAPGGGATSVASFTVIPTPSLTRLKPTSGRRGATVTITGTGFGAPRGSSTVKFGAKRCGRYLSWSDTRIKCRVPAKARYGRVPVTVTTAGGVSNSRNYKVKR
jgi:hypothetical protein